MFAFHLRAIRIKFKRWNHAHTHFYAVVSADDDNHLYIGPCNARTPLSICHWNEIVVSVARAPTWLLSISHASQKWNTFMHTTVTAYTDSVPSIGATRVDIAHTLSQQHEHTAIVKRVPNAISARWKRILFFDSRVSSEFHVLLTGRGKLPFSSPHI